MLGWYLYGIRCLKGHVAAQLVFISAAILFSIGQSGHGMGYVYGMVVLFVGVIWGMMGLILAQLDHMQNKEISVTQNPVSRHKEPW